MGAADQFTRTEFQRILDVSEKQLSYWEKLRLISPRKPGGGKVYDFRDLISVRTAKQLIETGIPANRLRRSLVALHQKLSEVQSPLTELRIRSNGKDVIVERAGAQMEPLSGQFVLNFETRELSDKVRVMPERSVEDWFGLALEYDADPETRPQAAAAYERALSIDPGHVDALINLGMLSYDQANFEKAAECFKRAVELAPENAIARFNLGSVLDEMGELAEARQELRLAVRLNPRYADAHYNLAFVCDKLGAYGEARGHWAEYIKLDPASTWCEYARRRLSSIG
jgi:DNA-binding transcriptional MerR regulator